MITTPKTLVQSLSGALRRLSVIRIDIDRFKMQFLHLLDSINDKETEEFHKNLVSEFLKATYYNVPDKPKHSINTKGRNDLVIHNGETPKTSVGVIIEAKKPTNSAEMPSLQNLNVKAFHELILYYLRERISHKNLEIKHLIITNVYEWFIFDVQEIDRLFAQNKTFVQQFQDFEEGRLADNRTDFFYKQIAEPFIKNLQEELSFTHFSLKDYETFARNNTPEDDKKLLELYKIFAPEHLLKLPFVNDSNTLDRGFYNELLHIMGLTEVKEGGKKLIQRKQEKDRDAGSILEETIAHLQGLGKMGRIPNLAAYGNTYQEQLFAVGLELCITWINRILFLKLLEAQLLSYHKGNKAYGFLTADNFSCASNLDVLFFQVLARKPHERSAELQNRFANVPHLNSSLFEVSELEHLTLVIGNLSTDIELPILPQTVLKDYKSNRKTGKLKTLDYLFAFLDAYDFGAEEKGDIQENNKPLITASVLGLVFEKINGYKDGSFFTPRFITMYMCAETIRKAVVQKFNTVKQWNCKTIADVYKKIEDKQEANQIINSLKICDPAVGSGHFLVSVLNELIAIKSELRVLTDKKGIRLRDTFVRVENDELKVVDEEGNIEVYKPKSPDSRRIQETLFREKQNLIENCLFGVDINPNSVKICRLRLWIELLKNAYYTEESKYTELETLPNLDINIKVGNSLVSRFALDADLKQALKRSNGATPRWTVETYRNAITQYFRTTNREQKRELEKLIADIKADFRAEISKNDSRLVRKRKLEGEIYLFANQNVAFETEKEKKEKAKKIEKLTQELASVEAEIEEMKANRIFENAFEWRFEFPEVLNEDGDFVGFDVIIGNPPYIRQEELKVIKQHLATNYKVFVSGGDIFYYFYELSHSLLKPNAYLAFITNTFDKTTAGKTLREFLTTHFSFNIYVDFTDVTVFNEATTYPIVFIAQKSTEAQSFQFFKHTKNDFNKKHLVYDTEKFSLIAQKNLNNGVWSFSGTSNQISFNQLLTKIQQNPTVFELYGKCYRGIITGLNEAFIVTQNLGSYKELKRVYEGKDIKKWQSTEPDKYMIVFESKSTAEKFGKLSEDEAIEQMKKNYPEIFNHLMPHKEKAMKRLDKGAYWWELRNCAYYDLFAQPKIIFPNLQHINKFAYDTKGVYLNAPAVFLPTNDKALLAILNSKVVWFFLKSICVVRSGGYIKVKPQYFEQIPIPRFFGEQQKILTILVDYIFWLKANEELLLEAKDKEMIYYFEQIIDSIVYELYFEEELKIQNQDIIQFIADLPTLSEGNELLQLREVFDTYYHPEHPVRQRCYYMDSVREVRIILGKHIH
jgi:hypothetical protein